MRRELFSLGRMARVVLAACGFIWLDLWGMKPPSDVASLTCLSVGQLAGLIAVFIPDVRPWESTKEEKRAEGEAEIEPG